MVIASASMVLRPGNGAGSPVVEVPGPDADRPSWGRVGVLAAVGFVVGVAWPKLAGVRLGPSVPENSTASARGSIDPAPSSPPAAGVPGAATTAPAPGAAPIASSISDAPAKDTTVVTVGRGTIASCRTADGDVLKGSACGTLAGLDGVIAPRLRRLTECPAAAGASGAIRLAVIVDFARPGVTAELGRGHAIDSASGLVACARASLANASLGSLRHDHPRYVVGYAVTLASGAAPSSTTTVAPVAPATPAPVASAPSGVETAPAVLAAPSAAGGASSDSTAQVEWEVAIVRDGPKTGRVIARLPRGSSLRVGSAQDGWYPVRYGEGFALEGWVYRGAIGR